MYEVKAYFDNNFCGLEDSFTTTDFDIVVDFSHEKLMSGYNVIIKNLVSGIEKRILSDNYYEEFDGEFIYNFEDFE